MPAKNRRLFLQKWRWRLLQPPQSRVCDNRSSTARPLLIWSYGRFSLNQIHVTCSYSNIGIYWSEIKRNKSFALLAEALRKNYTAILYAILAGSLLNVTPYAIEY